MTGRYVLDGHTPRLCPDLIEWGEFMQEADRHVARTELHSPGSPVVEVSTVFLGMDHAWGGGPPVLYETMTFSAGDANEQAQYCTWDEAVAGHARMVDSLRVPKKERTE